MNFNILKDISDRPPVFEAHHFKVGEMGIEGTQLGEASSTQIDFNASRVVPTSIENRPYTMKLLPVLIY